MSQSESANVEMVRRAHDHFGRTGQPYWEINDPEIEVFDYDIVDAANPYRGNEGVVRWLGDFEQSWDSYAMDLQDVVDAGDRVMSLFRIHAVGAGSGVPVERGDAMIWTFRDEKLVRLEYFNDQRKAREALGT